MTLKRALASLTMLCLVSSGVRAAPLRSSPGADVLVDAALSAPLAAERSALPAMPTARKTLEALKGLEDLKAPAAASARTRPDRSAAGLQDPIRINVYVYSGGDFNVYEPFDTRIDLRGYKPFSQDFDYRLSGRVGDDMVTGDARTKFHRDPTSGYVLNGQDFYATLDNFGRGWILHGNYVRKEPGGASRRETFNYHIRWDFMDRYEVFEPGLDLRIQFTSFSATVEGRYDKKLVGPMPLALIGTVAGILSQPKLRQHPSPRPL